MTTKTTDKTTGKTTAKASAEAITKEITLIAKQASTIQERIQKCGESIVRHIVAHGDCTLASTLINELPDGVRKKGLVAWFTDYVGINFDDQGNPSLRLSRDAIAASYQDAKKGLRTVKWWTCKPEQPFAGFDLNAKIAKLIKEAKKAQGIEGEDAKKVQINEKQYAALVALVQE